MNNTERAHGRSRDWIWFVLCALPPVLLSIYWHVSNQAYPYWDEAEYTGQAQIIQVAYQKSGILEAAKELYLNRTYKGLMHPIFASAALVATNGAVLKAQAITCVALFILLLFYVYLFLRQFLPKERSALGCLIIGVTTGVLENTYSLNSELPATICAIAALYHLHRSLFANLDRWHFFSFVFWLAIGVCVRPVESLIFLFPPVCYLVVAGVKRKIIGAKELVVLLLHLVVFLLYSTWAIKTKFAPANLEGFTIKGLTMAAALVSLPTLIVLIFRNRFGLNKLFTFSLAGLYLIVTLWYLPYIPNVYFWITRNTFAEHVVRTGNRIGVSYLDFLGSTFKDIAGAPLLILLFFGAANLTHIPRKIFFALFFVVLFHPLIGGLSYNGDPRYYAASGVLLYILVLTIALYPKRRFDRLRLAVVAATAIALIFYDYLTIRTNFRDRSKLPFQFLSYFRTQWRAFPEPPLRIKDPNAFLADQLQRLLPGRQTLNIAVQGNGFDEFLGRVPDDLAMELIGRERDLHWKFYYTYKDPRWNEAGKVVPDVIMFVEMPPSVQPAKNLGFENYQRIGAFDLYNEHLNEGAGRAQITIFERKGNRR